VTMNVLEDTIVRIKMLGGNPNNKETIEYCIKKSLQEAKDFCNVHDFSDDVGVYIVEWAVANYLTETDGYSKQWEKMRRDAEKGLLRFRRMMW